MNVSRSLLIGLLDAGEIQYRTLESTGILAQSLMAHIAADDRNRREAADELTQLNQEWAVMTWPSLSSTTQTGSTRARCAAYFFALRWPAWRKRSGATASSTRSSTSDRGNKRSLQYAKTCALSTSISRRGSPKNAPSRRATIWKGLSLGDPSAFQLLYGTIRNK